MCLFQICCTMHRDKFLNSSRNLLQEDISDFTHTGFFVIFSRNSRFSHVDDVSTAG